MNFDKNGSLACAIARFVASCGTVYNFPTFKGDDWMSNLPPGDYRIQPIVYNGEPWDGVYYMDETAYLGRVCEELTEGSCIYRWVRPAITAPNEWIPAPAHWREMIVEYLGSLE
jgi:hypothetical protein